jgi:hypothetical protein
VATTQGGDVVGVQFGELVHTRLSAVDKVKSFTVGAFIATPARPALSTSIVAARRPASARPPRCVATA